ncbi:DUF6493 family protein [Chryseobacterium potabilaquae]|uniref:Uncharacterized protein n=1 Tax=Chryseobacterium potabilaquae TaxID=2675057 RepID=A0A6N4X2A0_9FLAO|nr:DUF6493 family protein [Chryseobacterium potabilaquae]CAA7194947.1 hypothetical protein CHRY9293_01207 [Chryseobacterium potabilaquae]
MKERFKKILNDEQINEIIPFLKQLNSEERKALVPLIKKQNKDAQKLKMTKKSYSTTGSLHQHAIIDIASFVCMDQKEFKQNYGSFSGKIEYIDEILEWKCPEWFSDYINSSIYAESTWFGYSDILKWTKNNYLKPTPQLWGHQLTHSPSDLKKYVEALNTHFWYFCEFPSKSLPYYKEWFPLIKKLIKEKKIHRKSFLRECLLSSNRNFNKIVTSWFMNAFTALKPSPEELIELQDELLAGLGSAQSKAVNTILAHLRNIILHEKFKISNFLEFLPRLLGSQVKTIVKASLLLIESYLQEKEINVESLSRVLCAAFVNKEESIQIKVAKIIQNNIPITDLSKNIISGYSDQMLTITQLELEEYVRKEKGVVDNIVVKNWKLISEETKIRDLKDFEDFMHFLSEAIEHTDTYLYDLALVGFIQFSDNVKSDSVKLMIPVFQKACKIISKWEVSPFSVIICNLTINYGLILLEKFPAELKIIEKEYEKVLKEDIDRAKYGSYHPKLVAVKDITFENFTMKAYQGIATMVFDKVKSGNKDPLLSTITHEPCWIDPLILVERLEKYQNKNVEPYDLDFQLALQRCALDDVEEALKLAQTKLKGEYKEILFFLFNKNRDPNGEWMHPSWWLTASLTRSPKITKTFDQLVEYKDILQEFLTGDYSWRIIESKKDAYYPVELVIDIPFYRFSYRKNPLFLEYLISEQELFSEFHVFAWSFPNHLSFILAKIIKGCLFHSGMRKVFEKELIVQMSRLFAQIKRPLDNMGYLFLGIILLDQDKSVRNIASEIWLEHVSLGQIDNTKLGEIMGSSEKFEFTPLRYFVDVIHNRMINISDNHNFALEKLIACLLLQIESPITNLNKLLEIYHEILILNQSQMDIQIKEKLKVLKKHSSLKKICNVLLR